MQDPPSLILAFITKWEEGNQVVYGVRRTRSEGPLITILRKIFYRMINFLSDDELPHDAGDFRLVDRRVVDELKRIYDSTPYIRGTIASLGFQQVGVPYDRHERSAGESKFNFSSLINLAIDGILNHSIIPLRLAIYTGLTTFFIALLLVAGYVSCKVFLHLHWPAGFTTTTTLILISLSLNALFLGIIGEYLGRIFQQVKHRPITVIEESVNL
jgi:dolichol-phosphate mannosyltransferase